MADRLWELVTWDEFLAGLHRWRQALSGASRGDEAYLECLQILAGRSAAERAGHAGDIVTFLNRWACRVSRADTPPMLDAWIREHAGRLDDLTGLTIADGDVPERTGEIHALYDSLMAAGRAAVRNWSDAANSKALGQLVPELFVMWDRSIKALAADYGDFTLAMHGLARRLIDQAPYPAAEIEQRLQAELGYAAPKPLAKHLDEFNAGTAASSGR